MQPMSKQSLCTNVNNLSTRTNNKLLRVHSLPNSNRAATFSHQLSFLPQPLFALLSPRRDVVSCLRRCIYTPGPRDTRRGRNAIAFSRHLSNTTILPPIQSTHETAFSIHCCPSADNVLSLQSWQYVPFPFSVALELIL